MGFGLGSIRKIDGWDSYSTGCHLLVVSSSKLRVSMVVWKQRRILVLVTGGWECVVMSWSIDMCSIHARSLPFLTLAPMPIFLQTGL